MVYQAGHAGRLVWLVCQCIWLAGLRLDSAGEPAGWPDDQLVAGPMVD